MNYIKDLFKSRYSNYQNVIEDILFMFLMVAFFNEFLLNYIGVLIVLNVVFRILTKRYDEAATQIIVYALLLMVNIYIGIWGILAVLVLITIYLIARLFKKKDQIYSQIDEFKDAMMLDAMTALYNKLPKNEQNDKDMAEMNKKYGGNKL